MCLWLDEKILLIRKPAKKTPRGGKREKRKAQEMEAAAARKHEQAAARLPEAEEAQLVSELQLSPDELAGMLEEDRVPCDELGLPRMLAEDEARIEDEEEHGVGGGKLHYRTIEGYISAVAELYKIQVSLHKTPYPNFRGAAFSGKIESLKIQQDTRDRESFADRGLGGVVDSYTPEEYVRLNETLLRGTVAVDSSYSHLNLRTRVDATWDHAFVLRGESRRQAELCDLALLKYPAVEGQTPCYAAVITMSQGKMNKFGRKVIMGAMRGRDARTCPLSALSQYLFWRWHISGEPFPSFRRRWDWYQRELLAGGDMEKEISYPTQLLETVRSFARAGIHSRSKTHCPRRSVVQDAEVHWIAETQIGRAGKRDSSAMSNAYLTSLPIKFMRQTAGFSARGGQYYIPRAQEPPPEELLMLIFPEIEQWEERMQKRLKGKSWAQGGLNDEDLAANEFLKLLKYLRIVLLQDLAVLQPDHPQFLLFSDTVFQHPAWALYAEKVRCGMIGNEGDHSLLVEQALPELSEVIYGRTGGLYSQAALQHSITHTMLLKVQKDIGFLGSIFTGQQPLYLSGQPASQLDIPPPQTSSPATTATPLNYQTIDPLLLFAPQAPTPRLIVPALPGNGDDLGPEIAPRYTQRDIRTVRDLWRNWKVGIAGPAVKQLEQLYGAL